MAGSYTYGHWEHATPERGHPMGDKKSKKDKAKGQKQSDAKHEQAAKQKQNKQKPKTP